MLEVRVGVVGRERLVGRVVDVLEPLPLLRVLALRNQPEARVDAVDRRLAHLDPLVPGERRVSEGAQGLLERVEELEVVLVVEEAVERDGRHLLAELADDQD